MSGNGAATKSTKSNSPGFAGVTVHLYNAAGALVGRAARQSDDAPHGSGEIILSFATANSFPRIDTTGYQSLNSDNGVLSHDDITLGSIQLSHLFGNHFLRGGFEFRIGIFGAG